MVNVWSRDRGVTNNIVKLEWEHLGQYTHDVLFIPGPTWTIDDLIRRCREVQRVASYGAECQVAAGASSATH